MSCKCSVTLGNTGLPGCVPIMNVIKNLIIVPRFDNSGIRNFIDLTVPLDQAFFDAKFNHADPSKRWYPTPEIKNVTSEKSESLFEDFDDGSKVFIREGQRSFTGVMPKQSPQFLAKIKEIRCREIDVYVVDLDGAIIGATAVTDKLFGIQVDQTSWDPRLVLGNDSTIQKILLSFNFHANQRDEELQMILATEIAPVNALTFTGLIDVYSTYTNITTTGFKATLKTSYGSVLNPIKLEGLILADFALFNTTTSLAVTITSVTESQLGTYTFVIPVQASANKLRLTPTKTGFDTSAVVANLITIP